MFTRAMLILAISLSVRQTSCQSSNWANPSTFPSSNNWQTPSSPSAGYSQLQPYRAPLTPSYSSAGQYQSAPSLSTISQLSGYSGLTTGTQQSGAWNQYNPSQSTGARSWSIPSPVSSYSQPQSSGFAGYSRPSTPTQIQGSPFQSSWSINHQAASAAQSQPSLSAQPQSYGISNAVGSPTAQNWNPAPAQTWNPTPAQTWSPAPAQTYRQAPTQSWNPPPTQSWSAPAAPTTEWRPAQTQSYVPTQPQSAPTPPQSAAPTTSYQSSQNSQNYRPAPVHYANIGAELQGDYKFGYHTGDGGSFREETRLPDGTVQGAYGFVDGEGKQRVVKYRAGKDGFQAEGDDVPKGTPAIAAGASGPSQQGSATLKIDEGAAFRSFSQG